MLHGIFVTCACNPTLEMHFIQLSLRNKTTPIPLISIIFFKRILLVQTVTNPQNRRGQMEYFSRIFWSSLMLNQRRLRKWSWSKFSLWLLGHPKILLRQKSVGLCVYVYVTVIDRFGLNTINFCENTLIYMYIIPICEVVFLKNQQSYFVLDLSKSYKKYSKIWIKIFVIYMHVIYSYFISSEASFFFALSVLSFRL